jgi:hypothetical protein
VRLNAANADAGKMIGSIIERGMVFEASKYAANKHLEAVKANANATGSLKEFQLNMQFFEKANADIAKWEAAPTAESWGKMSELERMSAAGKGITGPRTPAMEDAIKQAKTMRDSLGTKLYGPAYAKLRELEDKTDTPGASPSRIVVTPEQLKNFKGTETERAMQIMRMLNPDAFKDTGGASSPMIPMLLPF